MASVSATANTLVVSLWHAFFYPAIADADGSGGAGMSTASVSTVLRLLDSVGYTKAGDVGLALEQDTEKESQKAQVCDAIANALSDGDGWSWPQQFFANCAVALLSGAATGKEGLSAVLARQRDTSPSFFFSALARAKGREEKPEGNLCPPPLFSLLDSSTSSRLMSEADDRAKVFEEAKLYAALCLHSYFPTGKPLAKLLSVYINQEERVVAKVMGKKEGKGRGKRATAELRAHGVVAGLLEYALTVAQSAQNDLREALHKMQDTAMAAAAAAAVGEKARSGYALPPVGPRPEQAAAVQSAVSLTLVQLMLQANQLKVAAAAEEEKDSKSSDPSTAAAVVDGLFIGKEIVHAVQELLFTAVLGAGTANMSNRPTKNQQQQQQQQQGDSAFLVTHRPLAMYEADAVTHDIFPSLLQQLGYEWPWSELLRHCRSLDKLQSSPAFPFVAQSSALVMETVLWNLSVRTYPQRLENLLPDSFDKLREKLGLVPTAPPRTATDTEYGEEGMARGGEGSGDSGGRDTLFRTPEYYKEPVAALLAYYGRAKLRRLRVDEAERVLTVAVGSLPMIVQLRALAPPDDEDEEEGESKHKDGGGRPVLDTRSYPLSSARVAALETRYKMECLLASVVVQTQLSTHSQVQGMMRELTPLFAKLALTLSRNASALATPLLLRRGDSGKERDSAEGSSVFVFTEEAEKLINDIGYQFYPLEWLLPFAQGFHEHQQQQQRHGGPSTTGDAFLSSSSFSTALSLPYSAYAAVAHQLEASFHSPLGNGNQNDPAGFRSSLVTAPHARVYLDGESGKQQEEERVGSGDALNRLRRARGLFEGLMLPCWLDARLSSGDLEGTMAVTATRAVVGGGGSGGSGGGGSGGGGGGGGSGDGDGLLARLGHLLKPHVLELFWGGEALGSDGVANGRKRQRDVDDTLVAKDEEAVRALTNALLRHGASSFELTMEAKDFVLAVAQCFLPSTVNLLPAEKVGKSAKSKKVTAGMLRSALLWCQSTVGSHTARADIRMRLQQRQQQRQQQQQQSPTLPNTTHHPPPCSIDDVFASVYNSCTFDSCALARRVLLTEVPARLLAKMRLRQQQSADLIARRDRCLRAIHGGGGGEEDGEAATETMSVAGDAKAEVDKLLLHQWSQYVSLLRRFALRAEGEDGRGGADGSGGGVGVGAVAGEAPELSAAQWLWYSPYSTAI